MTEQKNPETLTDLLRTLERSGELRSLARECGLSVRELRRRLAIWRRDLVKEEASDNDFGDSGARPAPHVAEKSGNVGSAKPKGIDHQWPELPLASLLKTNPLPAEGSHILEIFTDGASRGNPGPAATGVLFRQGLKVEFFGRRDVLVAQFVGFVRVPRFAVLLHLVFQTFLSWQH